jgi:transposase
VSKKIYNSRFKFQIVMDTFKEDDVVGVARRNGLDPNMISTWRSKLKNNGHEIFETNSDKEKIALKQKVAQLEQLIGHKEVEIKLLQNFFTFYESKSGRSSNMHAA